VRPVTKVNRLRRRRTNPRRSQSQAEGNLNRQNYRQNRPGETNGVSKRHEKALLHSPSCRPFHISTPPLQYCHRVTTITRRAHSLKWDQFSAKAVSSITRGSQQVMRLLRAVTSRRRIFNRRYARQCGGLAPSAQRYSKSATATIPTVFQHGDDQLSTGGWATYLRIAKRAATL
jgi:hypothetical protein